MLPEFLNRLEPGDQASVLDHDQSHERAEVRRVAHELRGGDPFVFGGAKNRTPLVRREPDALHIRFCHLSPGTLHIDACPVGVSIADILAYLEQRARDIGHNYVGRTSMRSPQHSGFNLEHSSSRGYKTTLIVGDDEGLAGSRPMGDVAFAHHMGYGPCRGATEVAER